MKSSNHICPALLASIITITSQSANALIIGHFDNSREMWGISNGYMSNAAQWLLDNGHTLVPTNSASVEFLSGVNAFYTGLFSSISQDEINAMQNFVNIDGGFLFIQQDHDSDAWHAPTSRLLANWGFGSTRGTYYDNSGNHRTVGASSWITTPNQVTAFRGNTHSAMNQVPIGFETLAVDSLGRAIMGVLDAGAGRSSDVFVATDIDFWSNYEGWRDPRNRDLWENIWATASAQLDTPTQEVSEPASFALFSTGLGVLIFSRRKAFKKT